MFCLFVDIGLCYDNDYMIFCIVYYIIFCCRLCYYLLDKKKE